jgi:hypothetical protein
VDWVFRKLEKVSKPRLTMLAHRSVGWLNGLALLSLAFLLALPIPIPWNNVPPAIFLVLMAVGLLERDGVLVLVGHLGNIGLWVLLIFVGNLLIESMRFITDKIGWTTPATTQQALLDCVEALRMMLS